MKKEWVCVLFLAPLLACLFLGGFSGGFKLASGDSTAASANSNSESWPMFLHDASHSGYCNTAGPLTNQTLWSYTGTAQILDSPAVANSVLYVGSSNGQLLALNASNGALVWSYQTGGAIYSSPAVSNGVVYFGSWDDYVYALNATNGELLWRYQTGSYVQSSPTVANDVVYIASYDAKVYALNANTGSLLWSFQTRGGAVGSSPAVTNGIVYIGDNSGEVYALNAATGLAVWTFKAGDTIYSSPAVADGEVYIGADLSDNGAVYALNALTGVMLWSYETPNLWVYSSPAVAGGLVYVGSHNYQGLLGGNLYALNASTGGLVWTVETGGETFSSPSDANGVVYIGGGDGDIFAVQASDGEILWTYQTSGSIYWASPAVASGVLYAATDSGALYAFGSSSSGLTPTQPITISNSTFVMPAQISNGDTINLTITGNITSSQLSDIAIIQNDTDGTTRISYAISGLSGTFGFINITIPKNEVLNGSSPTVYIDQQPAEDQGYTQDSNNYYIWYTTHFSTHEISISFTPSPNPTYPPEVSSKTATKPSPTPKLSIGDQEVNTPTQSTWLQVIYGVTAAIVIVAIIIVALKFVINDKR